MSFYESRDRGIGFELYDLFLIKVVVCLELKFFNDENVEIIKFGRCWVRRVFCKVIFCLGFKLGDFFDYG